MLLELAEDSSHMHHAQPRTSQTQLAPEEPLLSPERVLLKAPAQS